VCSYKTRFITKKFPSLGRGSKAMGNKGNVVLYLDRELVENSKFIGFNLSKTFENHLKQLMTQFPTGNSMNNSNSTSKMKEWGAEPDSNRRPWLVKPTS
jgi:hypothetical protein